MELLDASRKPAAAAVATAIGRTQVMGFDELLPEAQRRFRQRMID